MVAPFHEYLRMFFLGLTNLALFHTLQEVPKEVAEDHLHKQLEYSGKGEELARILQQLQDPKSRCHDLQCGDIVSTPIEHKLDNTHTQGEVRHIRLTLVPRV
jgi:hypothetical protein